MRRRESYPAWCEIAACCWDSVCMRAESEIGLRVIGRYKMGAVVDSFRREAFLTRPPTKRHEEQSPGRINIRRLHI